MSFRSNGGNVGKQVRSFYLDHEVGAEIDAEASKLGPNKASKLVEDLLREALANRRKDRYATTVAIQFSEVTSTLLVFTLSLWAVLVFI